MFRIKVLLLLLSCLRVNADYWSDRNDIIQAEASMAFGSDLVLTPAEKTANNILMGVKLQEYDAAFQDPGSFLPATHFFHGRDKVQQSKVFQFIEMLPKGGLLHTHDTAMLSDSALFNLTYEFAKNLYACVDSNGLYHLQFFQEPNDLCIWQLVSELRENSSEYDEFMKERMTLIIPNPREVHTDINKIWSIFMNVFGTVTPFITYLPVFKRHFYLSLKELHDDNVMYVEFRGTLPLLYDFEDKKYGPLEVVRIYKNILEEFKAEHPKFIDAKLIYAPIRFVNNQTVDEYVKIAKEIISQHSDFVIGFDLVGQEDLGEPLISFKSQLEELKQSSKLFFHAGETNWYGTTTDENLIDALLLGTKRIGHGYALVKHPVVLSILKEKEVAIEISPISNQVLLLVEDLRNHPGAMLFAQNYPIVICNDDPSFWGAKGLSYDWYMAYMGMASRYADLRFLKKLAINAIKYSGLDETAKQSAMLTWEQYWETFIQNVITDNNISVNLL